MKHHQKNKIGQPQQSYITLTYSRDWMYKKLVILVKESIFIFQLVL